MMHHIKKRPSRYAQGFATGAMIVAGLWLLVLIGAAICYYTFTR